MAEAKHTPAGDRSFRVSVLRNVAGGIALVAAMAALFWVIGSIGRADDPQLADGPGDDAGGSPSADGGVADGSDQEPDDEAPSTDGDDPAPSDDAVADGSGDGTGEATDEPDDAGDDQPGDAADPDEPDQAATDEDNGDAASEDDADGEDADEDGEDGAAPADIDPSSVTVQVLDGYQDDGGAAAAALAEELRDAGYDVVAENPALRYDVTAVLYTAGNESAAQQIAAEIDAAEVRAQPGNLSEQVMVHIVVGADRG